MILFTFFLKIIDCIVCSVRGTIERYKKACAASSNTESVAEANTQVKKIRLKIYQRYKWQLKNNMYALASLVNYLSQNKCILFYKYSISSYTILKATVTPYHINN